MNRLIITISLFAAIISLLFNAAISGQGAKSSPCLNCHNDIYLKAISFRYQHSVVRDQCPICHIKPDESEEEDTIKAQMNFPALQREWLINLDRLSENQNYQAEVIN